jgi:transposase-like protein
VGLDERRPVAGRDYPRDWDELRAWFPDDAACLGYLERLRWPEGFVCPRCGERGEPWRQTRGRLTCPACRHQTTATAGTIFDKTRTPLATWFAAVWYVTNQKYGTSALGLQRVLGLGSYQTAWTMLHKLRRAMVRPGRDRLAGDVEVDETYVGGSEPGVRGRETHKKAIVAIAVEIPAPRGFGRARLHRVPDVSADSLVGFVAEAVEPGSVVHTDGWGSYNPLPGRGYTRKKTVLSATGDPAHISMPAVHRVASLLKRWLLGTHQGAVRPEQLDYYLDEFTFRFNRRTSRSQGMLFYRLLEQAVATEPVPYDVIARRR